ncbi:undecaprenyldiphospho-muramoylpentapeptide beta-N-acetylglucosaminyltransferase [Streptococcaceae bacterium ESL0687]|nr:undecaprenyldiphospho-muramoylpentapeptide beta-N-acetylglucosaminyltransferase [Streptococcaceae bacterium ESL0687]
MKVLYTGGGSAGHVSLNLQLIELYGKDGWEQVYIGSKKGIEREMLENYPQVDYHAISTGKLRRYFSWENFTDIFKITLGVFQARKIIKKTKPDFIFSKGGFVSVPVVIGAKMNGVPVIIHESDKTMGLANKISSKFAKEVLTTFKIPGHRQVGAVIDDQATSNFELPASFDKNKKTILFWGGSLGAKNINDLVRENLDDLLQKYNVIHQTGSGNTYEEVPGYYPFEFINGGMLGVIKSSDFVVARAGSNSIFEILYCKKPNILVPLSAAGSRGDQIQNARYFEDKGYSQVIQDEDLTYDKLKEKLSDLESNKDSYIDKMAESNEIISTTDFYQLLNTLY